MRAQVLTTHLDVRLICLSVAVAIFGSYAALDLAQRSRDSAGLRKRAWTGGAGITMGLGIWSMHFIGMLALGMRMPVSYNGVLVVLSLLAAVLGASVSLAAVVRPHVSRRGVLSASAFMGFAIAAMHYLGMASMQMDATIEWNIALVALSLAIAFLASLFALWLIVRITVSSDRVGFGRRLVASVLLGLGVAGLHYTAMAASTFKPSGAMAPIHHGVGTGFLVVMLTVGAVVTLAVLIGGAGVDQQRAATAKDLSLVADIARELVRIGDARGRVCQAIRELAAADLVVLLEPLGDGQAVTATAGLAPDGDYSQLAEDPDVAASVSSARSTFIRDLEGRGVTPSSLHRLTGAMSVHLEALALDGRSIGVLAVAWRERVRQLPDRMTTILGMLGNEVAVAIDRDVLLSKLQYQSHRDGLTGLLNRRALDDELDRQFASASRHDRSLSVAMLDLDHFKQYNDTHGHQAGDRLLRTAAAAWIATLRQTDTIARYGGEEFVVVMPDCSLDAAVSTANRLRAAVPAGASCSAGVASAGGLASTEELIGHADRALYAAKAAGRNCTRSDQQPLGPPVASVVGDNGWQMRRERDPRSSPPDSG
jgi:diguanylate cyclase (GGDEF)-like protein